MVEGILGRTLHVVEVEAESQTQADDRARVPGGRVPECHDCAADLALPELSHGDADRTVGCDGLLEELLALIDDHGLDDTAELEGHGPEQ